MRAIIIATGVQTSLAPLDEQIPAPMLPILNKPVIEHLIEYLVKCGVVDFDVVLNAMPEKVEQALGDGRRWGCRLKYHLARDPLRPFGIVPKANMVEDIVVATTRVLADVTQWLDRRPVAPLAFDHAETRHWTGWLWLPVTTSDSIPPLQDLPSSDHEVRPPFESVGVVAQSMKSFDDILMANRIALRGDFPVLQPPPRGAEKGLWLSNNVVLHPTARIEPPVFVGPNCRILEGAEIGPNAVVGRDCIIDSHSLVRDSVVFAGTYVGEGLELDRAIADRNRLVSVKVGGAVRVTDDFLLSGLRSEKRRMGGQMFSRAIALVLLATLLPMLLLVALYLLITRRGSVITKRRVVRIPADNDPASWHEADLLTFSRLANPFSGETGFRHFCFCFVPALVNVVNGDVRFVGVAPRSPKNIQQLPDDWRALYLLSKAGIISEASVRYGPEVSDDELYAAEVFYSAASGRMYDFKLLLRYFVGVVSPWQMWRERDVDVPDDQQSPNSGDRAFRHS